MNQRVNQVTIVAFQYEIYLHNLIVAKTKKRKNHLFLILIVSKSIGSILCNARH